MENSASVLSLLQDLHGISGLRISLHDTEGKEILAYPEAPSEFCRRIHATPAGLSACRATDAEAFRAAKNEIRIYRCRYGLWEAVCPLFHYGTLSGFLMMGQALDEGKASRERAERCLEVLVGEKNVAGAVGALPVYPEEKLAAFAHIMTVCAEYLTLTGSVRASGELGTHIEEHLRRTYAEKITLSSLAAHFHCSRSTLITAFAASHTETVHAFLTRIRLEKAEELLTASSLPVAEISRLCGFSDPGYFAKAYKRAYGKNPRKD